MLTNAYIDATQIHPEKGIAQPGRIGILSVQGLGSPSPRTERFDLPRRHGAVDRTQFYAPRVLDIQGRIWADSDADVITTLDLLKQRLALDGADQVFKFRRSAMTVDEYLNVRVASPLEWDLIPGRHQYLLWAVQLVAADPRMYSNTLQTSTQLQTLAPGGMPLPIVFPIVFSGSGGSSLTITNGGNFPTPPTIRVYGPVVSPVVANQTKDKQVATTVTLGSSDWIEIQVANRKLLLNNVQRNDLIAPATTQWFDLAAGANVLRLVGSGIVSGTTSLVCEWRDARI